MPGPRCARPFTRLLYLLLLGGLLVGSAGRVTAKESDAITTLRTAAKGGDPGAMNDLGTAYLAGLEVPRDPAMALYWYTQAADLGNSAGQFNLGICYEQGFGLPKADIFKALENYRKAADQGLELAILNAGLTLQELHLQADATAYFKKGAEKRNTICMREYGLALLLGQGTPPDAVLGLKLLAKAADDGDPKAMLRLADYYSGSFANGPRNLDKMLDYLWRAAGVNVPEAMAKIAYCYDQGVALEQSPALALKWYKKAGEAGFAQAMVQTGDCYIRGHGVAENPAEGFKWYQQAANVNYPPGLHNVAVSYATGIGVAADDAQAFTWFTRAAQAGYAKSQYNLGVFYAKGRGTERHPLLAFYWYKQAAEQGDPRGLTAAGICYATGEGIALDEAKAKDFLTRAAAAGDPDAADALKKLAE